MSISGNIQRGTDQPAEQRYSTTNRDSFIPIEGGFKPKERDLDSDEKPMPHAVSRRFYGVKTKEDDEDELANDA